MIFNLILINVDYEAVQITNFFQGYIRMRICSNLNYLHLINA
jgi:hypothetical protein